MILSELLPFLKRIEAHPKKSLSQNFLVDPNIVRKILQTAEIQPGDQVLEIGPGPGALTAALLAAGARVYAVEKDTLFAKELSRFQTPDQRLSTFEADFLEFDLNQLPSPLKIVANLPYHITTPILEQLFLSSRFSSLTVMVQKEVAIRMAAQAGTKDFGCLSLFVQFYTQPTAPFKVPANCFYPIPKVDSAVIRLNAQLPPPVPPAPFFALIARAFQQRRKMLSSSLSPLFPKEKIKCSLSLIGSHPNIRPEQLPLHKWIELYNALQNKQL